MSDTDAQQQETNTNHQLIVPSRFIEEVHVYEGKPVREKIFALLGAIAVTGLVASTVVIGNTPEQTAAESVVPNILESVPRPPSTPHPFYSLTVHAKAAVVYDVHKGKVLYGKNEHVELPLASLTKLMTALVAVESLSEETHIVVSPGSLIVEGDSGLYANESWKISDLISFTMLSSSNDGANALAAAVGSLWQSTPDTANEDLRVRSFVERMNFRADELELQSTVFTNPTGLDGARTGGIGTAEDMTKLLAYIWENEPAAIRYTNEKERAFVSLDDFVHVAENTNEYVYNISGLLGGKTGYTDRAGGNLAVIYDAGLDHPIAIVVLGSTLDGRFVDVEKLVDATYEYIESGWYEYEMNTAGTSALAQ